MTKCEWCTCPAKQFYTAEYKGHQVYFGACHNCHSPLVKSYTTIMEDLRRVSRSDYELAKLKEAL